MDGSRQQGDGVQEPIILCSSAVPVLLLLNWCVYHSMYSPLDVFQADLCTRFVLIGLYPLSLQLTPLSLSYHQKVLLPWNTNLHTHLCTHIHARTNIHI